MEKVLPWECLGGRQGFRRAHALIFIFGTRIHFPPHARHSSGAGNTPGDKTDVSLSCRTRVPCRVRDNRCQESAGKGMGQEGLAGRAVGGGAQAGCCVILALKGKLPAALLAKPVCSGMHRNATWDKQAQPNHRQVWRTKERSPFDRRKAAFGKAVTNIKSPLESAASQTSWLLPG